MSSPGLVIPEFETTVRVRLVDTTALMVVNSATLIQPVRVGHEHLNLPTVAFLIEHEAAEQRVMFDLGVRKDYWNFPPVLQQRLGKVIPSLRVDKDVTEILEEHGYSLDSFSSVIWSHYHWDHVGNMAIFPRSTALIVGPGFKNAPNVYPGYPESSHSPIPASAFQHRAVREIEFTANDLKIGDFRAHDFFGDGSFYLLDTPGHCIGHMCGLARVTAGSEGSSFVLMGGDICHFPGTLRPSSMYSLPSIIPSEVLDTAPEYFPIPCPCTLFTDEHPVLSNMDKDERVPQSTPFYEVSTHSTSAYVDPIESQRSVNSLAAFDASPFVMVCLSHDGTLLKYLPTLNSSPAADLNDWKAKGWKDRCHWGWLNEMPRDGKVAKGPLVEGFWREGKPWKAAKDTLCQMSKEAFRANGMLGAGSGL